MMLIEEDVIAYYTQVLSDANQANRWGVSVVTQADFAGATDEKIAEWFAQNSPFLLCTINNESFEDIESTSRAQRVTLDLIIVLGGSLVALQGNSDFYYPILRGIRGTLRGLNYVNQGSRSIPILSDQSLINFDPDNGILMYQQIYKLKNFHDTPE